MPEQGLLVQDRHLVFAAPGRFNDKQPELSGLVLSILDEQKREQSGRLRLDDVFHLRLPAEVVALSACQTARGKDVGGECGE